MQTTDCLVSTCRDRYALIKPEVTSGASPKVSRDTDVNTRGHSGTTTAHGD